jgi:hypothetical protein
MIDVGNDAEVSNVRRVHSEKSYDERRVQVTRILPRIVTYHLSLTRFSPPR